MFSLKQICSRKIHPSYIIDKDDSICVFGKQYEQTHYELREKLENFDSIPLFEEDGSLWYNHIIVTQEGDFHVSNYFIGVRIYNSKLELQREFKPDIFFKTFFMCVRINNNNELVILSKDGLVYITDLEYNEKLSFNTNIKEPRDMAINQRGDIYVGDERIIKVFDKTGTYLFDITKNLDVLIYMVITKDDLLLVSNVFSKNLLIFNPDGVLLQKIKLRYFKKKNTTIQIDSKNRIYLNNNKRVTYIFELIQN